MGRSRGGGGGGGSGKYYVVIHGKKNPSWFVFVDVHGVREKL
jgi:hypothetical protein